MNRAIWILFVLLIGTATAVAKSGATYGIKGDAPCADVDPAVDGASSFPGEWSDALAMPDGFTDPFTGASPAGYFYYQKRIDWMATSAAGNSDTYTGSTAFIAHDIYGGALGAFAFFRINNPFDWNYVKVERQDGSITECWNFGGFVATPTPPHGGGNDLNEMDDGLWITAAGPLATSVLIPEGPGADLIVDVGFIVRKDEDPSTDRHWLPGMDEPGDPGWDWDMWYGCFARAGFNASFSINADDASPDAALHTDPNEVYEWCFHEWAEGGPPLNCTQWCFEWIDPPKRLVVYTAANWFIHWGPPPVPSTPTPVLVLLGSLLALGGYSIFRRRRRTTVLVTALALLALAIPAAGCGGSGGGPHKNPPPFRMTTVVPPNGYDGHPYPVPGGLPAVNIGGIQGGTPPFSFQLIGGALPPNVILSPIGQIHSNPPGTPIPAGSAGNYDFLMRITDAAGDSIQSESSLRIEEQVTPFPPGPPIPIELVQLDLVSVSPIDLLMAPINTDMAGVIKVRGGDPNFPYTFQEFPPGQLAAPPFNGNFTLSPGGVLRGQSPVPFGPQNLFIDVTNVGPPTPIVIRVQTTP